MKINRIFLAIILACISAHSFAEPKVELDTSRVILIEQKVNDQSLQIEKINKCFNTQNERLVTFESQMDSSQKLVKSLEESIRVQTIQIRKQQSLLEHQQNVIDSLNLSLRLCKRDIVNTAEQLGVKIDTTSSRLHNTLKSKADTSKVNHNSIIGLILIVVAVLLGVLFIVLLFKKLEKGKVDVQKLREKSEKINEEILNQFMLDMNEMKKLSDSLSASSEILKKGIDSVAEKEPDHSLIKIIADKITFMEMTLYKMDPKVRGYKQLSRAISQMKDNLLANGYELVEMLGKEYDGGLKVIANFVEDETLEEGKQIITGIVKPQINYKGVMIQAAQITVSQNI